MLYGKSTICFAVVIAVLLVSSCAISRLDAQGATGTIRGTVTDSSGAAIPEASIQVSNIGTGLQPMRKAD
jgi:hypothetical protein